MARKPARKPAKKPALNERQRRFAVEYAACGNASEAARRAGYRGAANVIGPRLFADVRVRAEIDRLAAPKAAARIADAEEIQAFWHSMLTDPEADPKDRLKASELLGKVKGLFIERRQDDSRLEITIRRGADAPAALPPPKDA